MGSKEIGLFSCQKDSYLKEVRMFFSVSPVSAPTFYVPQVSQVSQVSQIHFLK